MIATSLLPWLPSAATEAIKSETKRPCGPGKLFIHLDSPSSSLTLSDSHDSYRNCLLWDSNIFLSWGRCKKFVKRKKDKISELSQMCFSKPWPELSISLLVFWCPLARRAFLSLLKIDPNSFSHYVHVPGLHQPVGLASLPAHPRTSRVRRQQLPTGAEWRESWLELCRFLEELGDSPRQRWVGAGQGSSSPRLGCIQVHLRKGQASPSHLCTSLSCPLTVQVRSASEKCPGMFS